MGDRCNHLIGMSGRCFHYADSGGKTEVAFEFCPDCGERLIDGRSPEDTRIAELETELDKLKLDQVLVNSICFRNETLYRDLEYREVENSRLRDKLVRFEQAHKWELTKVDLSSDGNLCRVRFRLEAFPELDLTIGNKYYITNESEPS